MSDQPEPGHGFDLRTIAEPSSAATLSRALEMLAAFFLCSVVAIAQSTTPIKPRPIPETTPAKSSGGAQSTAVPSGTIKGRVVADDGRVLANTTVMASAINGASARKSTTVDSEGRFTFDDMPAAVYLVLATAPGYIDRVMSLGDPRQWPTHLIGSQVRIDLIKGGVITGLITNAKGQPLVGVPVRASSANPGMSLPLQFGGGISETDDRGIYRIYGLPSGQYLVNSGGSGQFGRFTPSGYDLDIQTYYPSSNRDTAVPVSVNPGEETTGIDIKYRGTEGRSISGTVVGKVDSASMSSLIGLMLSHARTTSIVASTTVGPTEPTRAFVFDGVSDGEYDVLATVFTSPTESITAATKRITVRGSDVTGVELVLTPMASMTGSITLEPIKPEEKCDKRGSQLIETHLDFARYDLKKGDSTMLATMYSGFGTTLTPKGEFSLRNLEAGVYRLGIKLPTEAWYVRAIRLPSRGSRTSAGTADRMPGPVTFWQGTIPIKSGDQVSGVSIVLGQDAAAVRGRVVTTSESPVPANLRAHLVPVEREEAANVLRYVEAEVESDGRFAFTNIAPGRYFVIPRIEPPAAAEATTRPVAFDAATRTGLRREAEALNNILELKPCERKVDVELKLKPAQ